MRKALLFIVVVIVAVGSFAAGAWVNESRQDSSKSPPSTATTPDDPLTSTETAEFCATFDEPAIAGSALLGESWHWDSLGDCLKKDR
jgi:hypothetical protein